MGILGFGGKWVEGPRTGRSTTLPQRGDGGWSIAEGSRSGSSLPCDGRAGVKNARTCRQTLACAPIFSLSRSPAPHGPYGRRFPAREYRSRAARQGSPLTVRGKSHPWPFPTQADRWKSRGFPRSAIATSCGERLFPQPANSSPMWTRIFLIGPGSVMMAMSPISPPHAGHATGNASAIRARSLAHAMREVSWERVADALGAVVERDPHAGIDGEPAVLRGRRRGLLKRNPSHRHAGLVNRPYAAVTPWLSPK